MKKFSSTQKSGKSHFKGDFKGSSRPKGKFTGERSEARADARPAGKSRFKGDARPGKFAPKHRDERRDERQGERSERRFPARAEARDSARGDTRRTGRPTGKFSPRPNNQFGNKPEKVSRTQRPIKPAAPTPIEEPTNPQGVMLWGVHAVREAWLNPERTCFNLWATESGMSALQEAFAEAGAKKMNRPAPRMVEKPELEKHVPRQAVHQGVVLEAAPLPDKTIEDILFTEPLPPVLLVLDQVTDPHNIGAILRTAVAFGVGGVIVTERHAPNVTGVLAKSASGALEHLPLITVVNLARALKDLREASYWCVGLAEEGERTLSDLNHTTGRVALVLGAEGEGLRRLTRENCDELARLPTAGPIGSLNVSNAAAIAIYEVMRQKRGK